MIMIIISVASLVFLLPLCLPQIDRIRLKSSKSAQEQSVSVHLNDLREALIKYSQYHQGNLPAAEKWAYDIKVYVDELNVETGETGRYYISARGYGFNKNLSNLKLKDISGDTVLFFEVGGDNFNNLSPDWDRFNISADEEYLRRDKRIRQIFIILVDGNIIECTVKNDVILYEKDGIKLSNVRWNPTKIPKF
ncbi:MAG: hypothetical protein NTW55_01300 [Planctomycetota bacterium]|nr:hypothetical protein [Planctomycetota bacterium]